MKIEFDPEKSKRNVQDRDLPFDGVVDFDWETATYLKIADMIIQSNVLWR